MPPFDAVPTRLFVRDGASQEQRRLPALQDGYFNLAEMSFPDLLAMACEYARLVKFYQPDNTPNGDWEGYFSADETVVIARILSTRLAPLQDQFERWWESAGDAASHWRIDQLPMTALATELLDAWTRALSTSPGNAGRKLHALLASVTGTLCEDGGGFAAFLPAPGLGLGPHWRGAPAGTVNKASMRASYFAFVKAIEMVQQEAARLLPDSLVSGEHDPGVALLIAFIGMAERLHGRLNRFTGAHLDFYYERVLRIAPLAAVPDHAYLVVAPCAPGQCVEVPAGSEFFARVDGAGAEQIFQAEHALLVSDARVRALSTLYFHRDPDSAPGAGMHENDNAEHAHDWPRNAWCQHLAVPDKKVVTDPPPLSAVPLLGAPKNPGEHRSVEDARFGFALASSVLLMREGTRQVTLTLEFDDHALGDRLESLKKVVSAASKNVAERIDNEDIKLKVLRGLFLIELTGPAGWMPVAAYYPRWHGGPNDTAAPSPQRPTLEIHFELSLEAPSVVPYAPALHGEDYRVAVPMVRLRINPDSYVYPFGLLRALGLAAASIAVRVSGCRQLALHNHLGMLSAALPFQPFGPLPTVGSYMIVGSAEAAVKTLTSVDVELEWGELPPDNGGFLDYYHDYPGAVDSDHYLASVEALADGVWGPDESEARLLPLFRTNYQRTASKRVLKHITLPCDSVIGRVKPVVAPSQPDASYNAAARNGFFKFTLAAPRFAFGHREYPHALSHAMTRNMRDKSRHFQAGVPDLPYTPVVTAISLNYRAIAHIDLHQRAPAKGSADHALIHLHPHGWEAIGAATDSGATLIPDSSDLGNLHIGLSASGFDQVLTLFFHLRDDSMPDMPDQLRWSYLSGNRWKALPQRNIVADSTSGFMTSGVIALNVPPDISLDHTVMPAGLYWLRVSASTALHHFCSIYTVYAHALRIARQTAGMGTVPSMILPAASIERSRSIIAGLGTITQVTASSGGALPENRTQMHTRIAERLRHKGRAVTPADYEALILQQFPEVYKVKCFPNLVTEGATARDWVRPGHVLIVALPHLPAGAPPDAMPHLNGKLVADIDSFVRALAPPAATIAVKPPVYEQIQVRCRVSLKEGLAGGHYITRLSQDLSSYLSPWRAPGPQVHFGWRVKIHDIASFIIGLDYIADVGGCSMLRVAPSGSARFMLSDTASGGDANSAALTPHYPWSVAVPLRSHVIEIGAGDAEAADLNSLDIGSTFIITTKESHGAP
ncbi:baseplate J/gp47 family protein [Massilia scottii]|uniref:baseplate J/gp47 family protein n=1 Tax=Massilia scottii TaxID=3057166 RepID=UPI0027967848|nr:baseplate J/gp47 family protein [Massilia sp. CCM 9029]MDQ1829283.1 baseplate J/gp47 family protein [Massilia sp. CCM 9029]